MRKTHRAFSGVFWLGITLAVNELGARAGAQDWLIHPAVIVAGVVIAPWFSAGRWLSPDIDHRWAPGPPRQNYHWRYHRGFTHRVWFASVLTLVFGLVPFMGLLGAGLPAALATVAFAPVNGWWSHLAGDMIYGRIKILGAARGLGWRTGGLSETGRPSTGGSALIVDPASKVCLGLSTALAGLHLILLVG
jgi:membrane-bound metal-dependent hydrolase YbcI (DUF457 family)